MLIKSQKQIQKLKSRVKSVEDENADLKATIEKLSARVEALENK